MADQLRSFRRYSRIFPSVPYGRHAARVGCSVVADAKSAVNSSSSKYHANGSSVKILALLCSKQPQPMNTEASVPNTATPPRKRVRHDSVEDANAEKVPRNESALSSAIGSVASGGGASTSSELLSVSAVEERHRTQESNDAAPEPATTSAVNTEASGPSAKSHVYVRVQYDRALIATLPIEVMRQQHPQVLIDYLLSMSVWA
ncbi:hypothetical protein ABB37_01523 [Leptomonas pyrrhocoris]|uniref:Uncharacterized protein n=1 Tax=Leptomonas pyrrhocoris TaxID=157538 RepID=A0A0N1J5C8_LEPPY|nr:hypothetical protein ABB37_01523 [Leptomonas pyrrhocoris]XP_015663580.1 hypothetical protein ABB37_01523 [Leptomonas pyrrhocoris]KPA85140.1 hypothetical protein ABB37_01523 [Leptomonas pyrrhocoris]KPA85141.1 hypothetical protein ABB37_01523 [Leptomonas pyrrhocoris]|eukprot:XP_015663579.1 hypothetical protein ABB37_01523 [Leptomonas pyrrhocoris]